MIRVGDVVSCRARGGRQYGKVEKIVTDEDEAEKLGVGPATKVLYTDQHGEYENRIRWDRDSEASAGC